MTLVLASNSPRRRELLALGGWQFRVVPAQVDETPHSGEDARAYVLRLAKQKAQATSARPSTPDFARPSTPDFARPSTPDFALRVGPEDVVIAADTTVVDGGELLGKPVDPQQAETMLRRLRGKSHQVYSALAVLRASDGKLLTDWCMTEVPMRDYMDDEITAYIATGDPLDKAGAYAIQHPGFKPVSELSGCYANVMGLPLCHLTRTLARLDIHPSGKIYEACQQAVRYDCPVYAQVLSGVN